MSNIKIGVLALQGDFKEHIEVLKQCNAEPAEVRLPEDLEGISGLVIPGGESTAIGILMQRRGLDRKIIEKHKQGMAIYGTCAGAILLSKSIAGSIQPRLGLLDIYIRRNDYGRQINSFEEELSIEKIGKFKGVFIRAPVIEKVNDGIKILSKLGNKPVFIQKGNILASTFHPELAGDKRVHQYFIDAAGSSS